MSENDLHTASGVLEYLHSTPFRCASVTPLSGGNANFTYRLHLQNPFEGRSTLVLKHAKPYVATAIDQPLGIERQKWEVAAMRLARSILPADAIAIVPAIHIFDESVHAIIMDDAGDSSQTLKEFLMRNPPSPQSAKEIGDAMGEFIGRIHAYGKASPEGFRAIDGNTLGRYLTVWCTYGRLVSTLDGTADDAASLLVSGLHVNAERLRVISELSANRARAIQTTCETFTHGDFWTGNVMVSLRTEGGIEKLDRLHVLDWELSKPGLPGLDVGQFSAELTLISRFMPGTPNDESARTALKAFLVSYEQHYTVDQTLRNIAATNVGAHFVAWGSRVPWGPEDTTKRVVLEGVDLLVDEDSAARWLWHSE